MLSYTIRLSVTTKEYKEVPLAQWKVELTPWNIEDTRSSSSWLWPGTTEQISLLLRTMVFLEVEMQGSILIPPDQLVRRSSQAVILHLIGGFATRKSSNELGFFVTVTSLTKIGEGRIWALTGDVLFPVTFKCTMLIVIRKDPRPYWCIIPNNVLRCKENRADLPPPWIDFLNDRQLNELVTSCLPQWTRQRY